MMRAWLLLLCFMADAVLAQATRDPGLVPPESSDTQALSFDRVPPKLVTKPPIEPLQAAFTSTPLPWAYVMSQVNFDADGKPVDVKFLTPSGDASLDAAILVWIKATRILPRRDQRDPLYLPFWFIEESVECEGVEAPGPECLRDYKVQDFDGRLPSPFQISSFAASRDDAAVVEVYFEHDASGRMSRIVPLVSGVWMGDAIWQDDDVRLKTSVAGYGRLRYRLVGVSDEHEAASKAGDDVFLVWKTAWEDDRVLIDKWSIESRLSIERMKIPLAVLVDVVYARIFYNANGMIQKVEPEAQRAEERAALRVMLEALLVERGLKARPGRAGSRRVKIYPDGSVLPVD